MMVDWPELEFHCLEYLDISGIHLLLGMKYLHLHAELVIGGSVHHLDPLGEHALTIVRILLIEIFTSLQ